MGEAVRAGAGLRVGPGVAIDGAAEGVYAVAEGTDVTGEAVRGAGVNLEGSIDGIVEGANVTGEDVMGAGVNLDGSMEGADVNGEGKREGGLLRLSVGLLEGIELD